MSSTHNDPIYFFREYEQPYGFLSQWYEASFTAPSPDSAEEPLTFRTTEQYMMYHKAILFHDLETATRIMAAETPKEQKALGREVRNFDGVRWSAHRENIVEEGNWNKFCCNVKEGPVIRQLLLDTGDRELVEVAITLPHSNISSNKICRRRRSIGMLVPTNLLMLADTLRIGFGVLDSGSKMRKQIEAPGARIC